MKIVKDKPIHVGLRDYVWIGDRYKDDFGVERENFCLINDKQDPVYFVERERFSPRNLIFQYAKEEYSDFAICLSQVEDFELIEMEQLYNTEELSIFGNYYDCDAAIIRAEYSSHQFYYWIRRESAKQFLLQSDTDLYGHFSKNESILLNYIYRNKRPEFNLANYLLKKEEIRKYIDGLGINRFAESYDREKHIDTLMFDYIKEEIEYDRKYITPKLMVWGI